MKYFRRENILPDTWDWWANGNILDNEKPRNVWGDAGLAQLRHYFLDLCQTRCISDVDLFVNKRDYPHLKMDLSEPYDFLFDSVPKKEECESSSQDVSSSSSSRSSIPLVRHKYDAYAPILSFGVSSIWADFALPPYEDWEGAVGGVFPPKGGDLHTRANLEKTRPPPWNERIPTAFFRGTGTGMILFFEAIIDVYPYEKTKRKEFFMHVGTMFSQSPLP